MTTIHQAYQQLVQALTALYENREANNMARIVFEDAFKIFTFDSSLPFSFSDQLNEIQKELLQKKPLQYVLGQADFYGLKFKTTPAVLIPRPETEELIYNLLESIEVPPKSILDIGTGSGCIPITLKKKLENTTVYAVDISAKALEIAQENARLNEVEVHFLEIDILNKKLWNQLPKVDIIISNPPYIPMAEKALMNAQVIDYEPSEALFVENEQPLIFYQTITAFAQQYLNKNGWLYFECNEFNAPEVKKMLEAHQFQAVELLKDMEGKNRMVRGCNAC